MAFQKLVLIVLSCAFLASSLPGSLVKFDTESIQRPLQPIKAGIQKVIFHEDGPPTFENKTIYEVIKGDPRFTRLTRAIKFSDDIVDQLNDSSVRVTFFATPDWALHKPKEDALQDLLRYNGDVMQAQPEMYDLSTAIHAYEELAAMESSHDDSEKKRHRKFLRMLIRIILSYHIIPWRMSTYPTNLSLRFAMHDEPQRIRVESSLIPPSTTVNFYSKVVSANTQTMNGLIHVVNHPTHPSHYRLPGITSAWQRSGLTDALDLRWVHGKGNKKGHIKGTSVTTAFVPTNHAFELLPKQLQHYLFSPFGAHTLKKLLQFHVIPDLSLHTDETYDDPLARFLGEIVDTEEYSVSDGSSELISSVNITAPTLLPQSSTQVWVHFWIPGRWVHDNSEESDWEDWEEWLPKWAMEA
ncbi:uncharacterized protein EV420DRAFT_1483589 [Desarmillaria tabescens]|uniref:FAS1 domain-containing protein n=1 Tax=Armillaria tabescens TaxID=1929756 RepID=A0AA39JSY6_ARMTA|nr:uncharacterized protein EV420DRAFT_1483589 [Desarmillaria tabescens]KAK0448356.1 hypothetical protein EV420DRAFT_1483589 [Desarmillaria tabescens]